MDGTSAAHEIRPPLTRIDRTSAIGRISDVVLQDLTAAIRENRLVPGAPLSEGELATQLGVSRTPVREAISRLAQQKLLRVISQVGTSVSLIDVNAVREAAFVRSSLETSAFREACRVPDRARWNMRGILDEQNAAIRQGDAEAFLDADERLHATVFAIAGYDNVWRLVRDSKVHLDRVRHLVLSDVLHNKGLAEEHTKIVDYLEEGNEVDGVEVVWRHAHHVLEILPAMRELHPEYFAQDPTNGWNA